MFAGIWVTVCLFNLTGFAFVSSRTNAEESRWAADTRTSIRTRIIGTNACKCFAVSTKVTQWTFARVIPFGESLFRINGKKNEI